mmetsp:Transcript_69806/g.177145  ORF Transcript_69806/g.177145 Transcript_69806/m.177145 type:complete len:249 (+) Transcript_69806:219-965(+)
MLSRERQQWKLNGHTSLKAPLYDTHIAGARCPTIRTPRRSLPSLFEARSDTFEARTSGSSSSSCRSAATSASASATTSPAAPALNSDASGATAAIDVPFPTASRSRVELAARALSEEASPSWPVAVPLTCSTSGNRGPYRQLGTGSSLMHCDSGGQQLAKCGLLRFLQHSQFEGHESGKTPSNDMQLTPSGELCALPPPCNCRGKARRDGAESSSRLSTVLDLATGNKTTSSRTLTTRTAVLAMFART